MVSLLTLPPNMENGWHGPEAKNKFFYGQRVGTLRSSENQFVLSLALKAALNSVGSKKDIQVCTRLGDLQPAGACLELFHSDQFKLCHVQSKHSRRFNFPR